MLDYYIKKWLKKKKKIKVIPVTTAVRACMQKGVFYMTYYNDTAIQNNNGVRWVTSVCVLLMLALTLWHRGPPSLHPNTFLWFQTMSSFSPRPHGDKGVNSVTLCPAISLTYLSGSVLHRHIWFQVYWNTCRVIVQMEIVRLSMPDKTSVWPTLPLTAI